jgi:hypothetical protein
VTRVVAELGAVAVEWTAQTMIDTALSVQVEVASWLEQRFAETGNGAYALAGIEGAIQARRRVDERWLLAYLADVAGATMSGQLGKAYRAPGETLGDALAKRMRLNSGVGKDAIEEVITEIRDHEIYFGFEALLKAGVRRHRAIERLAHEHERNPNTIRNIISRIASTREPPAK